MSIADIKTTWLRRLVLVAAVPIVLPLVVLTGVVTGPIDMVRALWAGIKAAWRGR